MILLFGYSEKDDLRRKVGELEVELRKKVIYGILL